MAGVKVITTVAQVRIELSRQEALALLQFFGSLDANTPGVPAVVREVARKFRDAVQGEVFETEVS